MFHDFILKAFKVIKNTSNHVLFLENAENASIDENFLKLVFLLRANLHPLRLRA